MVTYLTRCKTVKPQLPECWHVSFITLWYWLSENICLQKSPAWYRVIIYWHIAYHLLSTWERPNILQAILWTINGPSGFVFKPRIYWRMSEKLRNWCFNESIDNSGTESFARIISNALCWYKYRKTNKRFYFGQLIPGTEMLWNIKCSYFWVWVYFFYCGLYTLS